MPTNVLSTASMPVFLTAIFGVTYTVEDGPTSRDPYEGSDAGYDGVEEAEGTGMSITSGGDRSGIERSPETLDVPETRETGQDRLVSVGGYMMEPDKSGAELFREDNNQQFTSDSELFERDTEQWLRKYKPGLSDDQMWEELREVQRLRMKEFVELAIELHPDLKEKLPIFPVLPPKPRKRAR